MTVFSYTWNATFLAQPADTDDEAQGAQRIRDTKAAVGERIAVDHSLNGDANDGKHYFATLRSTGQTTAYTLDSGDGRLWASSISGKTELFYQDSNGNVTQITKSGALNTVAPFVSGTLMLFAQASPPTGWTQNNSFDDKLIRSVAGTGGGTGGSWTITGGTVAGHALTTGEMPSHNHQIGLGTLPGSGGETTWVTEDGGVHTTINAFTANQGSGSAHTHGLSFDGAWRPAYFNVIVASKN